MVFNHKAPPPGIEPGCLKGCEFESHAVPLCHGGLVVGFINQRFFTPKVGRWIHKPEVFYTEGWLLDS